jgi:hypothetical protein
MPRCQPPFLAPALAAVLTAAVALSACSTPATPADFGSGQKVDFTIGGITFHAASGGHLVAGAVRRLFLTDTSDTCSTIGGVPRMRTTTFELQVAATASGATTASVVAPKLVPGPGEAVGSIKVTVGTTTETSMDASDGTVSWTASTDGTVTITAIDVGFAGTGDRLTTGGLVLLDCSP